MHKIINILIFGLVFLCNSNAQKSEPSSIVQSDGLFFTDISQTKLYTGDYREFYDNGTMRLEMYIKDGKPEGDYVVYFPNGKPNEIRSYRDGKFHGTWRTYNEAGVLIPEAV